MQKKLRIYYVFVKEQQTPPDGATWQCDGSLFSPLMCEHRIDAFVILNLGEYLLLGSRKNLRHPHV